MSETKLNIARQTNALLRRLDLSPPDVKQLTITPSKVEAIVYARNTDGQKYVVNDGVATYIKTIEVRT